MISLLTGIALLAFVWSFFVVMGDPEPYDGWMLLSYFLFIWVVSFFVVTLALGGLALIVRGLALL